MPSLRVVLGTNVLVSGLACPGSIPGQIVAAWRQGAIDVVISRYILDEVARVLPRLNHRLHWDDADFTDLLEILAIQADLVEPRHAPRTPCAMLPPCQCWARSWRPRPTT